VDADEQHEEHRQPGRGKAGETNLLSSLRQDVQRALQPHQTYARSHGSKAFHMQGMSARQPSFHKRFTIYKKVKASHTCY